LGFETTLDVSPMKAKVVAQDRAVHALEFGPYGPIRVTLQANLWRDNVYGGDLTKPEAFLGLAIDL